MLKLSIVLIVFFAPYRIIAGNNLDSLLRVLKTQKQDTLQANTLFEITSLLTKEGKPEAKKYAIQGIEKALLIDDSDYLNQAIALYIRAVQNDHTPDQMLQFLDKLKTRIPAKDLSKICQILIYKASVLESSDSTISAANMYEEASQMALKSKDTTAIMDAFVSKGVFYKRKSNRTLALEAFITALKYSENKKNTEGVFPICINLGTIYEQMLDLDKAIELYEKAESIINKEEDPNGIAIVYYKIGKIKLKQLKYNEAKDYLGKVYEIHVQRNDREGLIVSASAISGIYYELKEYDEFLKWMKISIENAELTQNQQGLASDYSAYGKYYEEIEKNYPKALEYYKKNLTLDINKLQLSHIHLVYKQLYNLYEKLGDYPKAFEYFKLFYQINDSLYNSDIIKKQTELKLGYEFDKIQRQEEIENKVKESEQKLLLEKEKQRRNFFIVFGILAVFLLLLNYRSYRIKRKANVLLGKQNIEIERQKKLVDEKNKEISDSINYARHIQSSILPVDEELKASFASHVLYFKPKDIVSGDFYWHISQNNKVFFAIADCTGHGVPGSIMSMIGNILLNEIIMEKKIYEPADILFTLNNLVKQTLRQKTNLTNRVKDGMDIALCSYDKITNKLLYAGANMPLYVVGQTGEIRVHKPDKAAIGGYTDDQYRFTQTEVMISKNEWAYLFSDGIIDQFGGDLNKKFTLKRMKKLVTELLPLSPAEKLKAIEQAHSHWQKTYEQTDDILVFGFEV